MTITQDGEKCEFDNNKKYVPGFRFGIGCNPTFKYGLGLKTGINLDYAHYTTSNKYNSHSSHDYVDIGFPIQISYRYEVIRNLSLMLYTGPVLNLHAYAEKDACNPDDVVGMTWGIGAAVQWKRLRLNLGGDFGIFEQWNSKEEGDKYKYFQNSPIYVTLGVML